MPPGCDGGGGGGGRETKRAKLDEPKEAVEDEDEDEDSLDLIEAPHPYGVKPRGNLMAGNGVNNVLASSLGSLRRLDDACLLLVLGKLPPASLCKISAASRGMYAFAHDRSLWRDLCLALYGGDFTFGTSWKETCIRRMGTPNYLGHTPMHVRDCYSDVLYDPWLSTALRIDPSWLKTDNIKRRSGLTKEQFVTEFETPGIPVVLTDVVKQWLAATEWKGTRLAQRFGDTKFRVSATVDMSLKDYLAYASSSDSDSEGGMGGVRGDERPLYLFEKDVFKKCPEMESEFAIPPQFDEDLMQVLGRGRPDYRWLIMGPARSGSSFHVDPNCNFAWNACIQGRKKWVLYPPGVTPPLEESVSLPQWFARHYDSDHEGRDKRLECVTGPGELMYVPRGWWHCVMNLEFSVALTHNVVTLRNLLPVVDYFGEEAAPCTPGSGCRGDVAVYSSGDVPTSVIFPYRDRVRANNHIVGGVCKCMGERRKMLKDIEEGMERHMPGVLKGMREEREKRQLKDRSVWARLNLLPQEAGGDAPPPETFSFGFGGTDATPAKAGSGAGLAGGFAFRF